MSSHGIRERTRPARWCRTRWWCRRCASDCSCRSSRSSSSVSTSCRRTRAIRSSSVSSASTTTRTASPERTGLLRVRAGQLDGEHGVTPPLATWLSAVILSTPPSPCSPPPRSPPRRRAHRARCRCCRRGRRPSRFSCVMSSGKRPLSLATMQVSWSTSGQYRAGRRAEAVVHSLRAGGTDVSRGRPRNSSAAGGGRRGMSWVLMRPPLREDLLDLAPRHLQHSQAAQPWPPRTLLAREARRSRRGARLERARYRHDAALMALRATHTAPHGASCRSGRARARLAWLWRSALVPPWLAVRSTPQIAPASSKRRSGHPHRSCPKGVPCWSLHAIAGCSGGSAAAAGLHRSSLDSELVQPARFVLHPGSGIAVLSVLCTLHARCGTRAACTCFSAAPHTHQAACAFAGPPAAPTARHGPPNSVITVCYRSQPGALEMYVVKRSGKKEPVHFDKITARIAKLCTDERAAVSLRKRV